jgi:hypothetical protein
MIMSLLFAYLFSTANEASIYFLIVRKHEFSIVLKQIKKFFIFCTLCNLLLDPFQSAYQQPGMFCFQFWIHLLHFPAKSFNRVIQVTFKVLFDVGLRLFPLVFLAEVQAWLIIASVHYVPENCDGVEGQ